MELGLLGRRAPELRGGNWIDAGSRCGFPTWATAARYSTASSTGVPDAMPVDFRR
jgi:hypothetical protein